MAINKIIYGSNTLIDLTDTTAEASDVLAGKYFYGKDVVKTLGTGTGGIDGDNLEYGLIDATSSLVGVGKVGSMIIE